MDFVYLLFNQYKEKKYDKQHRDSSAEIFVVVVDFLSFSCFYCFLYHLQIIELILKFYIEWIVFTIFIGIELHQTIIIIQSMNALHIIIS